MTEPKSNEIMHKIYSSTKCNSVKLRHEWKIYNYSISGKRSGDALTSKVFSDNDDSNMRWTLQLYPNGSPAYPDYVLINLNLQSENTTTQGVQANCTASILNKKGEESFLVKSTFNFGKGNSNSHSFPTFARKSDIIAAANNYLPNDCLTLICTIVVATDTLHYQTHGIPEYEGIDDQSVVLKGYESLFNTQKLYDVTLSTPETEFNVHKAVLASQSEVFFAMFNNDTKEKKESLVKVEDIDEDVLQELLRFCYTGKVQNMETLANELLVAADKYAIKHLKTRCELYLSSQVKIDNVVEMINISDVYNAEILKKYAIDFFILHAKDVLITDGFKNFKNLEVQTLDYITKGLILK